MAIEKGVISTVGEGGKTATAVPSFSDTPVSATLTVPFYLIDCLEPGMAVVYTQFPDNTGVVLARMDGEWNHKIWQDPNGGNALEIVTGDVAVTAGDVNITAGDMVTSVAAYNSHIHTCPDGSTGGPH